MLQHEAKERHTNEKNHVNNAESHSLRAYDSVHLTDPDEGNFFVQNFSHKELLEKELREKELREKELREKELRADDVHHAYIASFILCQRDRDMADDLVFWRTYGREGEGCSLSLMVDSSCLQTVLYGADKVSKNLKDLQPALDGLHELRKPIKETHVYAQEKLKEKLAEIIWEPLEKIRYLYKSEAYDYEKECRFILTKFDIDKKKIRFEYQDSNNAPARLRHYYEHNNLAISRILSSGSSIVLGPCVPYRDNIKYCIEKLKKKTGLHYDVKVSKINYRKS